MAFVKHGSFTTSVPPITVDFFTISRVGDIDLKREYRFTEQSGTVGEFARDMGRSGRDITIMVTGDADSYNNLVGQEGKTGNLTIRDETYTVKLLNAFRVEYLGTAPATSGGFVSSINPTYVRSRLRFFRES